MNGFQPQSQILQASAANPAQRVNYTQGMVLGIDDFNQEFAYHSGRDKWNVRDLLGYGTVTGLKVSIDTDVNGPRVSVSPGTAVSPSGQRICVSPAQCAYLNQWITKHRDDLLSAFGSPPNASLQLYVVLSYAECFTLPVPIPGEPCRTEQESMASSRVADSFSLELRTEPPGQKEEDALRSFVEWLSMIPVDDTFGDSTPLDDFLDAIRNTAQLFVTSPQAVPASPLAPDSFMSGSPPSLLHIQPKDFSAYLRSAFRIWVTEVRPTLRMPALGDSACDGSNVAASSDADCLLLARLDVPLTSDWLVSDKSPVAIDERDRPILLHQRLLQELITSGIAGESSADIFIGSPPVIARHTVVAAGVLRGDNSRTGPVLNNLSVIATAKGEINFMFDGYSMPTPGGNFHYIVKAIAVANINVKNPNVSFLEFRPDRFALSVAAGGVAATQAQIQNMEFMIEVSRFA